jgi:hypothetical protein
MEALPPNPRDFALSRQDSWTERRASARSLGIPAPESALGLRLRRALPSAQVRSVYQGRKIRNVAVYTKHLTLPPKQAPLESMLQVPRQKYTRAPTQHEVIMAIMEQNALLQSTLINKQLQDCLSRATWACTFNNDTNVNVVISQK